MKKSEYIALLAETLITICDEEVKKMIEHGYREESERLTDAQKKATKALIAEQVYGSADASKAQRRRDSQRGVVRPFNLQSFLFNNIRSRRDGTVFQAFETDQFSAILTAAFERIGDQRIEPYNTTLLELLHSMLDEKAVNLLLADSEDFATAGTWVVEAYTEGENKEEEKEIVLEYDERKCAELIKQYYQELVNALHEKSATLVAGIFTEDLLAEAMSEECETPETISDYIFQKYKNSGEIATYFVEEFSCYAFEDEIHALMQQKFEEIFKSYLKEEAESRVGNAEVEHQHGSVQASQSPGHSLTPTQQNRS